MEALYIQCLDMLGIVFYVLDFKVPKRGRERDTSE